MTQCMSCFIYFTVYYVAKKDKEARIYLGKSDIVDISISSEKL